jgi:cytochrome c553
MRTTAVVIGLLAAFAIAGKPASAAPADVPAQAAKCEACHDSGNVAMPRLEGQPAPYLATRIRSFADLTVQNPHAYFMFDINASLSDAMVVALAKYISVQPAVESAGEGPLAAKGEHLYRFGEGADIGACQGCHGASAEGGGTVPRLAGQRAAYLRAQLEDFSLFTRVHDTMNVHARRMTEDQVNALVAFLSRD